MFPSQPPMFFRPIASRWAAVFMLALLLTACGGGLDSTGLMSTQADDRSTSTSSLPASYAPPSAATVSALQEGARLNTAELEAIARTGVLPNASDGPLLGGADPSAAAASAKAQGVLRKSAASRVPVYRFFNTRNSAHFFTTSTVERDNVIATLAFMSYEGPAFSASATTVPGLSPVHRFYNTQTGVHFYTISESERALVASTLPQFTYEGVAYYASTLPGTGYTPLYRFFYTAKGFHFYTNSAAEKDTIIATLPQYHYEGVGYYALGDDWQTPAIPHSGVSSSQCYQAGSFALVSCSSTGALALNPMQDGHRSTINRMSYSFVGNFAVTSCVKDDVTGLIWEGKRSGGSRDGTLTYTHLGNNAANDTSGYLAAVNGINLCGFSDWRLPTVEELESIAHFGVAVSPRIDTNWIPNTNTSNGYWTSDAAPTGAGDGYVFYFIDLNQEVRSKTSPRAVRLVRGTSWSGPRHVIASATYAGDAANNAVIDRKTGVIWRRCLEGQSWNGSACTGTAASFSHAGALDRARGRSGWILPAIRELASLANRVQYDPALDAATLFPGATGVNAWSSTPYVTSSNYAWVVSFTNGQTQVASRDAGIAVRLMSLATMPF
ncbi:DUF1566 domain-containing protein [Hydrogenophaga sp. RWCD_12]|uniref:DUF1566 domain-containing protein n=1 Tax=Hydrogenophaga sp. RWCD_12 TaxID=3391190 RepID=UPI00398530C8